MGAKGPLTIVSPLEWTRRTSLTFSKRSPDTLKVDDMYQRWSASPTNVAAGRNLNKALNDYLQEKGGSWKKIKRNTESGGLMEYIHGLVRQQAGIPLSAAQKALERVDIPHSRYGVLFLLGNIEIEMNKLGFALEGVAMLGNAAGQAASTNFNHLDNAKLVGRTVTIEGQKIGTGMMSTAGKAGVNLIGKATGVTGTKAVDHRHYLTTKAPVAKPRPTPGFPTTMAMYEEVKEDPALYLNPFMLGVTLAATAVGTLYDAFNSLRILIRNLVVDLAEMIISKLSEGTTGWTAAGTMVKGLAGFVVGKCMEAAVPFIGGAMDLAGGIAKTVKAAKDRLGVWMQRRQIVLNPGHPELLAHGIESQMNKGIFAGLWSMLKGVASIALAAFLPGAGSVVAALVTGIEWLVKFIWRVIENSRIATFLKEARKLYLEERARAHRVESFKRKVAADGKITGVRMTGYEPNLDPHSGGIIHDLERFKKFYQRGCDASPLIPMLTLNSGICGSLMVLLQMFDPLGNQTTTQKAFDAGENYFTRLKTYSRAYLAGAGFEFKVVMTSEENAEADREYVQGLLNHSVRNHQGIATAADKALAFMAG